MKDVTKFDLEQFLNPVWEGEVSYAEAAFVREAENGKVSVRSRFAGDEGQKTIGDFIDAITREIKSKEIRKIEVTEESK